MVTPSGCGPQPEDPREASSGMIGFDIAWMTVRSGSRMQSYLVNALCKTIGANTKRADLALAV